MIIKQKISMSFFGKKSLKLTNFPRFFLSGTEQKQNVFTFKKINTVFPFEDFIKQAKMSYDPSILSKMEELIQKETKFQTIQHHLHLFRKFDFWNKDLINSLVRKMFELGYNYKTIEKVVSLWGVLIPVAKFLDSEESEMAKKLFFQGFDVINAQKEKASPNTVIMTFRLAKQLDCYYPEFVNFLAQLDLSSFKVHEIIYFLRDFAILKTTVDNLQIEKKEKTAFNKEFEKIITNDSLWSFINKEIAKKFVGTFDERVFIEILMLMNKFSVGNAELRATMLRIYKAKISQLSVLTFTKGIFNFLQINEGDQELADLTKRELMVRISNGSADLKTIFMILKAIFSYQNCLFPPDKELFERFGELIVKNQIKIDLEQTASILLLFAKVSFKKPEIIKLLFDKIKESNAVIPYYRFAAIFRALAILEYYEDKDLMRIFEEKLYDDAEKRILSSIREKNDADYRKIVVSLVWGMHAILVERPEIIQNLDKFKERYEFFMEYYFEFVQLPLINNFSAANFGRFGVYPILKVLGFRPIPEKIVDIFNIDIVIPNINSQKLREIRENLHLESAIEKINRFSSNPSELSQEIEKDKVLLGNFSENIDKENSLLIELHGPNHYIKSEEFLKGGTLLKERILRKSGYKLLVFPYSECLEFTEKFSRRQIFLDLIEKIENAIKFK